MDPEQPVYGSHHRIDESKTAFERDDLDRRLEAELGRENK